jgi:ACS family glucarate transporter-like MFS transporter
MRSGSSCSSWRWRFWAVISDAAPREIAGLSGGLFNLFGNLSSITTPIIIGYIIQTTGSFDDALLFIGANSLLAILSYLVVVGEIKRLVLRKPDETGVIRP